MSMLKVKDLQDNPAVIAAYLGVDEEEGAQ